MLKELNKQIELGNVFLFSFAVLRKPFLLNQVEEIKIIACDLIFKSSWGLITLLLNRYLLEWSLIKTGGSWGVLMTKASLGVFTSIYPHQKVAQT